MPFLTIAHVTTYRYARSVAFGNSVAVAHFDTLATRPRIASTARVEHMPPNAEATTHQYLKGRRPC